MILLWAMAHFVILVAVVPWFSGDTSLNPFVHCGTLQSLLWSGVVVGGIYILRRLDVSTAHGISTTLSLLVK
jgi:hypothetical protein